jgi:8-oxo-dGTP diphosphatase
MSTRPAGAARAPIADLLLAICTVRGGSLVVLVRSDDEGDGLPHRGVVRGESLDDAADQLARKTLGVSPAWMAQARAQTRAVAAAGPNAPISITYAAVVRSDTDAPTGCHWAPAARLRGVGAVEAEAVSASIALLRDRMDLEPIAFRLLPPQFTLSELQGLYELLLGRRLHKASFRRALTAAFLVAPTDHWRSEGRGRPAQLFRYAPRRGRRGHRPVRLELLK